MKKEQFYEEVLNSDICPENFHSMYTEFAEFQALAINTLKAFHDACEKNNINYQLAFGSLLGAIRDDGQIPWDYDIDVIVPYDSRWDLINALKKDLDEMYYFYCPETNPECRHQFMRVAPKGYDTKILHVDVFYMIGAPVDQVERYSLEEKMRTLFQLKYVKQVKFRDLTWKQGIKIAPRKLKAVFRTVQQINTDLDRVCSTIAVKDSEKCIPVLGVYPHLCFDTNSFWDTELICNSLGEFRVTKDYVNVLKLIYKDYTKIYPLVGRLNEFIRGYNHFTGKNIKQIPTTAKNRYYM